MCNTLPGITLDVTFEWGGGGGGVSVCGEGGKLGQITAMGSTFIRVPGALGQRTEQEG